MIIKLGLPPAQPYGCEARLPSGIVLPWSERRARLRDLDPADSLYPFLRLPRLEGGAARVYKFTGQNMTVSTKTLIWVSPSATIGLRILRWRVDQNSSTTSGMQRIQVGHVSSKGSPTLTAATVVKSVTDDPTSGYTGGTSGAAGTVGVNASSDVTTTVIDEEYAFHIFSGMEVVYTPKEAVEIKATNTAGWSLIFPTAPTTTTGWNVCLTGEEI